MRKVLDPRKQPLVTDNIYHLYNRGVAKQDIFSDQNDYSRLLATFAFYVDANPITKFSFASQEILDKLFTTKPDNPLVAIIGYCLMPNHFHLLVKQLTEGGISTFIRKSLDSFTRYYNTKYGRVGTMFQGKFKHVLVEKDNQLAHVSRYIHLNPFVAQLVDDPAAYKWSSYTRYLENKSDRLSKPKEIFELLDLTPTTYQKFAEDYAELARSATVEKNIILD